MCSGRDGAPSDDGHDDDESSQDSFGIVAHASFLPVKV